MPVEIGKLSTVLEQKLKEKGLTKTYRDNVAKSLAPKIEKDEDIDAYIDDRLDLIVEAGKEGDRRAQTAAEKARKEAAEAVTGKTEQPKTEQPKTEQADDLLADTPAWAREMINQNKELATKVAAMESQTQAKTLAERFKTDERLKEIVGKVPETLLKGRIPSTEAEYEQYVTEAIADLKPIADALVTAGFGNDKPLAGGGTTDRQVKVTEADPDKVKAVMELI